MSQNSQRALVMMQSRWTGELRLKPGREGLWVRPFLKERRPEEAFKALLFTSLACKHPILALPTFFPAQRGKVGHARRALGSWSQRPSLPPAIPRSSADAIPAAGRGHKESLDSAPGPWVT